MRRALAFGIGMSAITLIEIEVITGARISRGDQSAPVPAGISVVSRSRSNPRRIFKLASLQFDVGTGLPPHLPPPVLFSRRGSYGACHESLGTKCIAGERLALLESVCMYTRRGTGVSALYFRQLAIYFFKFVCIFR